jgi:hypothetical protein
MYVIASGSCQSSNTTVAEDKADAATYGVPLIAAGFNA